ncbi:MAG: DUF4381 domain-containing protein [Magnetococcus sp. YQC-5]
MNQAAPLELRDIHLPDPVSWWPPALGWWLVMLLFLFVLLAWGLYRLWSRRYRIQKIALAELEQLSMAYLKHQDGQRLTGELSALLRRVCLVRYPRHQVAGLAGEAWLDFLDQGVSGSLFSKGPGRVLITAPFQRHTQVQVEELMNLCRQWIRAAPKEAFNLTFMTTGRHAR